MAHATDGNKLGQINLSPAEQAAALLSAIAACAILASVLVFSRCGFDLTDEGYYFLSMENPRQTVASITQFGFLYHPLYVLMHGSVALVRMANYSATFGLAWILCLILFKQRFEDGWSARGKIAFSLAVTAALASASLLVSCFELPQSLSYNTLAFQAILIGIIGLLLADSAAPRPLLLGHFLIGLSWWMAFMAKPTTAAGLGLLGLIYLVILGKFRPRLFAVSIVTAALLLLLSAWMIGGSLSGFIHGYLTSLAISSKLAGSNLLSSIWGWDLFPLAGGAFWSLIAASIILSILVLLGVSENRKMRRIGLGLSIALSVIAIDIAAWGYPLGAPFKRYDALFMLALPAGCLIAATLRNGWRSATRRDVALLIVLLLMPHAYAFGTGRPIWLNAEGASLFWFLSGLVLVSMGSTRMTSLRMLVPIAGAVVLMTGLFVASSLEYPMRQTQALRRDSNRVSIGPEGGDLYVSADFAAYLDGLRQLARAGGFKTGTPIIDLTGHSPGVVYALGGVAPAMPWLMGGYPGSGAFAAAVLDRVSCKELANAWVLTEPSGPGHMPEDLLSRYGIEIARDYEDLGSVQTPAAPYPVSYRQHLMKPKRKLDEAETACASMRDNRS